MQIIFIHHSCFLVELDDKVLIFDYFDGDKVEGMHFTGKLPSYEPDTKIYMFASHSHKDHYDMDILRLADKYPNIHYVFSKDIRISPHFLSKHGIDPAVRDRVTFVSPDNTYHVDDLDIMTLRSTDAGVAFYVASNGVSLFHAGDLNDWEWDGAGDLINGRVRRAFRPSKVAATTLTAVLERRHLVRISFTPAASIMIRTGPPAITPVPGAAGFISTRPAPASPVTS